jgi:hypothetical protein
MCGLHSEMLRKQSRAKLEQACHSVPAQAFLFIQVGKLRSSHFRVAVIHPSGYNFKAGLGQECASGSLAFARTGTIAGSTGSASESFRPWDALGRLRVPSYPSEGIWLSSPLHRLRRAASAGRGRRLDVTVTVAVGPGASSAALSPTATATTTGATATGHWAREGEGRREPWCQWWSPTVTVTCVSGATGSHFSSGS